MWCVHVYVCVYGCWLAKPTLLDTPQSYDDEFTP